MVEPTETRQCVLCPKLRDPDSSIEVDVAVRPRHVQHWVGHSASPAGAALRAPAAAPPRLRPSTFHPLPSPSGDGFVRYRSAAPPSSDTSLMYRNNLPGFFHRPASIFPTGLTPLFGSFAQSLIFISFNQVLQ